MTRRWIISRLAEGIAGRAARSTARSTAIATIATIAACAAHSAATLLTVTLPMVALALGSCSAKKPSEPLRLGIMPDADSLPLLVADAEGLFGAEGVAVELVSFANAQERDAAFQAGRLDGTISDLLAAALLASGGFDVRVTSVTDGRYGIAAAPGSGIARAADLAGRRVGLSANTIIQYSVDAIASAAGLEPGAYIPVAIPKMPVRMEMLLSGQVDAAGLPEPFLTAALARGAAIVGTTEQYGVDAAVILFSKAFLDTRLDDVRRMYKAYASAAARINADESSYRAFLVKKAAFPAEASESYRFVRYREPTLPALGQVGAAVAWLEARGLLKAGIEAASLIDGRAVAAW